MAGGVEAFLAHDADGGSIAAGEEIVVVERLAPRTVLVTPLAAPSSAVPTEEFGAQS